MSWRDDAACLGEPTEWWYPDNGDRPDSRAVYLCSVCPVADDCDTEAVTRPERHGWWAGIDRHKRRRGAPVVALPPPVDHAWVAERVEQLRLAL